jgi:hypothetical protein
MFSTFSSSVMPSASVTWKSWVLPTRQTAAVPRSGRPRAPRHCRPSGPRAWSCRRRSWWRGSWGPRRKTRCRWGSPGPAAFDIVDPEGVERLGDADLLGRGELHALGLLPVAEGGVVEGEAGAGHGCTPTGIKPKAPVERLPVWRFGNGRRFVRSPDTAAVKRAEQASAPAPGQALLLRPRPSACDKLGVDRDHSRTWITSPGTPWSSKSSSR